MAAALKRGLFRADLRSEKAARAVSSFGLETKIFDGCATFVERLLPPLEAGGTSGRSFALDPQHNNVLDKSLKGDVENPCVAPAGSGRDEAGLSECSGLRLSTGVGSGPSER